MALSKAGLLDVVAITGETALAAQPAATDEVIINDGGTIKRLDIKHIQGTPAFEAYLSSSSSQLSDYTDTKV